MSAHKSEVEQLTESEFGSQKMNAVHCGALKVLQGTGLSSIPAGVCGKMEIFLALSQHPACHMHFTIACQLKSVSGLSSWSFAGERWGFPGVPGKHTLRYHNWESAGEMNCLRAIII